MKQTMAFYVLLTGSLFVRAADPGRITGTVDDPKRVTAVNAIDRATDKKYPGKVDAATGRFTVEVPLGVTCDLLFDCGGTLLEGIKLKVPRSDFEEEQPMTKEDIAKLKETAKSLNKFEDIVEVMTVTGNIQHAAVLLNKLRTKPFVNSLPGEVIWRLELWHFERPDETWIKSQDELFLVLYRKRMQKSEFDKISLTLDSALGGLQATSQKPTIDLGKIELPAAKPGIRLRPAKGG